MRYNQLGKTGLFVSEICLGTMTFDGGADRWRAIGQVPQAQADRLVETALAAGVNFIDTADVYSEGNSERMLGQSLKTLGVPRQSVVIATKAFGAVGPGPNDRGASRGHLMDAVKASLDRLGTDHIDLYQIHGFDAVTPIEETMRALDDLVSEGLIRYIGCSNWPAWHIMKALGIGERHGWNRIASLQAYYSIAGRDIEREIVPLLNDQGLGLMVWSPLAGGLLSGKFSRHGGPNDSRRTVFDFPPVNLDRAWNVVDAMRGVADRLGVSVARVALAWILSKPHVTTVIIGARTPEQLTDNLAATTLTLSAEDIATLDSVSALPAEYPGWMLAFQGAARVPQPFAAKTAG